MKFLTEHTRVALNQKQGGLDTDNEPYFFPAGKQGTIISVHASLGMYTVEFQRPPENPIILDLPANSVTCVISS